MPELRVGDFLTRRKEVVQIEDDRNYRQVTIGLNHGGVRLRGVKPGAEIGTKRQYLTRADDFILSRIDARNAAFGIVPDSLDGAAITNDFWSFEIDRKQVDPDYFYLLSQTDAFLDACVRSSTGTTNRQRIQAEFFLDYVFSVPTLADQVRAVERYRSVRGPLDTITAALDRQAANLGALRQRVLDDAVRGRLTERDPADEPAHALLAEIAAEKQRRYEAGEIRKPKTLPPVGEDEQPFEVPEGWAWVQANDLLEDVTSGSRGWAKYYSDDEGRPAFIRIGNLNRNRLELDLSDVQRLNLPGETEGSRTRLETGDILISITADLGSIGVVPNDFGEGYINQHIALARPVDQELTPYISQYFLSPIGQEVLSENQRGGTKTGLGLDDIRGARVPLPPLEEQRRIVERVGALLALCDRLADRLAAARADAERLTQTVLADALAA